MQLTSSSLTNNQSLASPLSAQNSHVTPKELDGETLATIKVFIETKGQSCSTVRLSDAFERMVHNPNWMQKNKELSALFLKTLGFSFISRSSLIDEKIGHIVREDLNVLIPYLRDDMQFSLESSKGKEKYVNACSLTLISQSRYFNKLFCTPMKENSELVANFWDPHVLPKVVLKAKPSIVEVLTRFLKDRNGEPISKMKSKKLEELLNFADFTDTRAIFNQVVYPVITQQLTVEELFMLLEKGPIERFPSLQKELKDYAKEAILLKMLEWVKQAKLKELTTISPFYKKPDSLLKTIFIHKSNALKNIERLVAYANKEFFKEIRCIPLHELPEDRLGWVLREILIDVVHLDLEMTHLTDLIIVSLCDRIEFLSLKNCSKLATLYGIHKLKRLQTIDLRGCRQLSSLEELNSLTQLKKIHLSPEMKFPASELEQLNNRKIEIIFS